MRSAIIVIGSSYGDEGKGLATALAAHLLPGRLLNVLINGGAQRGHTVDLGDGRRHVFRHFGSAALFGAVSCADEDFIVNPLIFGEERRALAEEFHLSPALLIHEGCRASTPYDMMLGQIIEENRGAARHGSCGCGIQETRLRFMNTDWALPWGRLAGCDHKAFEAYCRRIVEEYIPARLDSLRMKASPAWRETLADRELIRRAWAETRAMAEATSLYADWKTAAKDYDSLIFEAGQGLALDQHNLRDFPHLTPSSTTSQVSAERIAALEGETDTTIFYVTRSYLTRHGAGPFPTECRKEDINPDMNDRTNVPNPHQQTLRYGWFDGPAVRGRIFADLRAARRTLPRAKSAVLVTHLNETKGSLAGAMSLEAFAEGLDQVWTSFSPCEAGLSEIADH